MNARRRGAGVMAVSPPVIAGPTVAAVARRFRFAFKECQGRAARERRRRAVAEYLAVELLAVRVLAEQREGRQYWLWCEVPRPLDVRAIGQCCKRCPNYVGGTFKVLG